MSRRIEIELTSSKEDGSWTWRAAGAREPKGAVDPGVIPAGASVGDVLRVDADFFIDGITITGVVTTKETRTEPDRLELLTGATDEPLVTSTVTKRERDDRDDRRGRGDKRGDRRPRGERRPSREGESGGGRPRRSRPEPPPMPAVERPKAKRLRPKRAHRKALLDSLPEEQHPIVEQLFSGGLPAVRQALAKQNEEQVARGEKQISEGPLLGLAEQLLPRARSAEWRDRAEAALADVDELDLRDLRSVVSQADSGARDDESRLIASQLREALAVRVDKEHGAWLAELSATLDVGRVVRALRVSSRPPKAGAPLPTELADRLAESAAAALTADAAPDRWVAVLDALALSPVRDRVIPASLPTTLHDDVRTTVARLAARIPKVAHIFDIEPDPTIPRPRPPRGKPRKAAGRKKQAPRPKPERRKPDTVEDDANRTAEPKAAMPEPATEASKPTPQPPTEAAVDPAPHDAEAPSEGTALDN